MPGEGVALTGRMSASRRYGPLRKSECKSGGETKRNLRPRRLGQGVMIAGDGADFGKRSPGGSHGQEDAKASGVQVMPIGRLGEN